MINGILPKYKTKTETLINKGNKRINKIKDTKMSMSLFNINFAPY